MLALFTSTYTNKVDKKGRVSVPPPFRALASSQGFNGIHVFPSLEEAKPETEVTVYGAIDGCGAEYFNHLAGRIDQMDPFSVEREAFSFSLFGASHTLAFDGEGRVALPESLMAEAGITDTLVFVGLGRYFRIWEPKAHAENSARLARITRERRASLALAGRPRPADGGQGA
ncbi:division/cell wall cluster transcriptional repressor MraZ [Zavarzinia compransoris]|uniref:Transcriptional regulator MraZ n=1 Tax=Zavarzinia compransoris TaxID=1264899 RepID=A0A317DTR3_9PROT|nr:division/cell wall cluster transcriptional repressor MraZ [Zavarzinia compransoris]PWR18041.1 division/cell wall cluster transcriptional repressor MraZ [Zavarzinia compransoris]TDP43491.1 MraZ protein [Zavarzinia compransoris]